MFSAIIFFLLHLIQYTTATTSTTTPPPSISRSSATYDWCDCATGLKSLTIWPLTNKTAAITIQPGPVAWIHFKTPTSQIGWTCNGMTTTTQQSKLDIPLHIWSVQILPKKKGIGCSKTSGRLHFANWNTTKGQSVVYSSGEQGYSCIKIPVLLHLKSGRLLAFAEARMITCSDFAWTDLVMKSSNDNGVTWSELQVVRSESNATSVATVIGNAAPVQLATGEILVPHTRNNSDVWTIISQDEGKTWTTPQLIGTNVTRSDWKWVGTGPPGRYVDSVLFERLVWYTYL